MFVVESAGITDIGRKRTGNEDALHLDDERRLYVVADGMGGHQAGEVASALIVETMREYFRRIGDPAAEIPADDDDTLSREAKHLLSSIQQANLDVNRLSHTKASYRGMGSTVSAVYLTAKTVVAANVGDSPIYLIHNDNIELISVIHTVIVCRPSNLGPDVIESGIHLAEENVETALIRRNELTGTRIEIHRPAIPAAQIDVIRTVESNSPDRFLAQTGSAY